MTKTFPQKEETNKFLGAGFNVYADFGHFSQVEYNRFLNRRLSARCRAM